MNRVKLLMREGVKIGTFVSIPPSLLYGISLVIVSLLNFSDEMSIPEFRTPTDIFEAGGMIFLVLWVIIIVGVLPAMIIGGIGGGIIGFVLAIFKKKLSGIWSILIGLITGYIFIVLIWNLLISIFGWEKSSYFNYLLSLFKTGHIYDFVSLMIYFPYFIPSIIAILISPYVSWKINKTSAAQAL